MKIRLTDFVNGIMSLVISQIFIKVFGVIYSIYMTNKTGFGDEGNAIYMSGYQIYALLLTVSSIGVPNAISKMISEKRSQKDYINSDRIFKVSLFLFAIIGSIGCISLFTLSKFISNKILDIPEAKLSLMALSPAIFFVTLNSVIKGYFNGINKIYITAKTQFYEQVLKSIFTILFVEIASAISNNNTEIMAAVANLATTVATFFSFIYILRKYLIEKDILLEEKIIYSRDRILKIIKNVLIIAVPMTLNAILSSTGKNIDSITIVRILKDKIGEELAIKKYGIISSKIDILVSMPLAFNSSISTALIPEISRMKSKNDLNGIIKKIEFSILITLLISIPYAFGIYSYSNQIFNLLFPKANEGATLLQLSAFGIVFAMLTQTINAILQGFGKNSIPVYASFIGLIFKVLSNIILIPMKGIYENGAILGNILSNFISFIIVYKELRKIIKLNINVLKISIKPILGSILMIVISLSIYNLLIIKNINDVFSTLISIVIAVVFYVFCIFVMKMINLKEIFKSIENSGF